MNRFRGKKLISFCLCMIIMLSILMSNLGLTTVNADSNDIRKTYIEWAQSNSVFDTDGNALLDDPEALRFLALFLSNFYVPSCTRFDDKSEQNGTKAACVQALTQYCGYSQETAEMVVAKIYEYTLETCRPLYVDVSDVYSYDLATGKDISVRGYTDITTRNMHHSGLWSSSSWRGNEPTFSNKVSGDGDFYKGTNLIDNSLARCTYGVFIELMAQQESANIFWAEDDADAITRLQNYHQLGFSDEAKEKRRAFLANVVWNWNPYKGEPLGFWSTTGRFHDEVVVLDDIVGYTESLPAMLDSAGSSEEGGGKYYKFGPVQSHWGVTAMSSYLLVANRLDYDKGYGNALFYIDGNTDLSSFSHDYKDSTSALWKICSFTAPLYVDWVGNIVVDTGIHRVVVVPACQNPYSWSAVRDGGWEAGEAINGVTTFAMSSPDGSASMPSLVYFGDINSTGNQSGYVPIVAQNAGTLMKNSDWKIYVGSSSNSLDNSRWIGLGDTNTEIVNKFYTHALDPRHSNGVLQANSTSNEYTWLRWALNNYKKQLTSSRKAKLHLNSSLDSNNLYALYLKEEGGDAKYGRATAYGDVVYVDSFKNMDMDESTIKVSNIYKGLYSNNYSGFKGSSYSYFSNVTFDTYNSLSATVSNISWFLPQIYLTYLYAYTNGTEDKGSVFDEASMKVDMKFEADRFPTTTEGTIDWSTIDTTELTENKVQSEITSFVYYFLHPSKGAAYISSWLKSKMGGFLISVHSDIVGGGNSVASTGMTRYLGFSGYTTLPTLNDVPWIAKLLENYSRIIIFLIVIIVIVLCCYVIVGSMTLQRALFGMFLFGVLAFIPPIAITATTNVVNRTSDGILSKKFEYWALVQHQTYLSELTEAISSNNKDLYGLVVISAQSNSNSIANESSAGYGGVKVKWMSPKKENYMASVVTEADSLTSNTNLKAMFYNIVNPALSGQSFANITDALYLYRDYTDIVNYAMTSYNFMSAYENGRLNNINETGELWLSTSSQFEERNDRITYKSGMPVRDMLLRNYGSTMLTGYTCNQDLWGTTSLHALHSGFINKCVSIDDGIVESKNSISNSDYYRMSNRTSNLHINYLINTGEPALKMLATSIAGRENTKARNTAIYRSLATLGRSHFCGGTDSEGRTIYGTIGIKPSEYALNISQLKGSDKISSDGLGYFYYGLYTESPYYYFSYLIQDNLNNAGVGYRYTDNKSSSTSKDSVNYLTKMLLKGNLDFFYNYAPASGTGYGELKDFMNMHDLFYYVIPILECGNNITEGYEADFGIEMFDDIQLKVTPEGHIRFSDGGCMIDVGMSEPKEQEGNTLYFTWEDFATNYVNGRWDEEKIYKFWHNYQVISVLNCYTPWVGTMNDCSYAKPETIMVSGEKFVVEHPLDPTSYFTVDDAGNVTSGRFMVFSRSEMKYYGLEESDLTTVERKIIAVQDNVFKKAITLMNYSNFDDDVVISGLAFDMLFEFNKEFSEEGFTDTSHILYPTGYELRGFTYDGYMRLILAEATGEGLMSQQNDEAAGAVTNGSIYEQILNNTSVFFLVFLIILDVIVTYVVPLMRLVFLILLFLMSIVMIISHAVKIELDIGKVVFKTVLAPLFCFGLISIGLAWVTSLFMSNGYDGIVKSGTTISLGDPTMTVIAMLIINIVVVILYWKILTTTFANFKKFTGALATNIGGTVAGAFKTVTGAAVAGGVLRKLSGIKRNTSRGGGRDEGGSSPASNPEQRGADNTGGKPKPKTDNNKGTPTDAVKKNSIRDKINSTIQNGKKKLGLGNKKDGESSGDTAKEKLSLKERAQRLKTKANASKSAALASEMAARDSKNGMKDQLKHKGRAFKNSIMSKVYGTASKTVGVADKVGQGAKKAADKAKGFAKATGKKIGNSVKGTANKAKTAVVNSKAGQYTKAKARNTKNFVQRNAKKIDRFWNGTEARRKMTLEQQEKMSRLSHNAERHDRVINAKQSRLKNSSKRDAARHMQKVIAKNKEVKAKSSQYMRSQGSRRNKRNH